MAETNITVLGAGVIGLTTALLLSKNPRYCVTLVAKHMPGDYDIEYASPWAGANYEPVGKPGTNLARFERNTWAELERLTRHVPQAGIHFQALNLTGNLEARVYNRTKDSGKATHEYYSEAFKESPWFKDVVLDFKQIPKSELPTGIDSGTSFVSVCIDVPVYLAWLVGQCLKQGVQFKRAIASHVADAAALHHSGRAANIVVVLVRNEPDYMWAISGTDDGEDEATYIMQRAAGGGTILGGCVQKDKWESQPDPNLAIRIMKRAVTLSPTLTGGKGIEALDIVRHGVGLRPMRKDGPRVEKERISANGLWVVHNYGHGGYGYQASYGSALEATDLVDSICKEKARL